MNLIHSLIKLEANGITLSEITFRNIHTMKGCVTMIKTIVADLQYDVEHLGL